MVKATSVMVERGAGLGSMRRALFASLAVVAAIAAGCGSDDSTSTSTTSARRRRAISSSSPPRPPSIRRSTTTSTPPGIDAKQSFAGSDELAAQIRQGVTPDVYAAANTSLPDDLYKDGLVGKPIVFATNTLVLAVPADSRHQLDRRPDTGDVTLAIGDEGCRSATTRARCSTVCRRTSATRSSTTCARSEPDVSGISASSPRARSTPASSTSPT